MVEFPFIRKKRVDEYIEKRLTQISPTFFGSEKSKKKYWGAKKQTLLPSRANVSSKETYFDMIKDEPMINAAINYLVYAVIGNGYDIVTYQEGDIDKEDPKAKKIRKWFDYPDQPEPFCFVLEDTIYSLLGYGNTFTETEPNQKVNSWMFPLDTRDCEFEYDKKGTSIIGIRHRVENESTPEGSKPTLLLKDKREYVHSGLNKGGKVHGISPLESLVRDAEIALRSDSFTIDNFISNGIPPTLLALKDSPAHKDYETLVNQVKNLPKGASIVARGDVDAIKLGSNRDEVQYDELMETVFLRILAVFHIPPHVFGLSANREGSREEANAFTLVVKSLQNIINNHFNRIIINCWGEEYSNIRFKLRPNLNTKAQYVLWEIGIKNGFLTPNDVRRQLGLPLYKGFGDEPYVQNFLPYITGNVEWEALNPKYDSPSDPQTAEGEGQPSEKPRPNREGEEREKQLLEVIDGLKGIIEHNQKLQKKFMEQAEKYDEGKSR